MPPAAKRGPYAGLTDDEIAEWRLILRFYDPISNGSRQEAWRDFKDKVQMQRRDNRRRQPGPPQTLGS